MPMDWTEGLVMEMAGFGSPEPWLPTIGNICMDMTMIDVTGMNVSEGDEVELFGKNLSVGEVCQDGRNNSL